MKRKSTAVIGMVICCMMITTMACALPGIPNGTVTDGNVVWLQNADCFGGLNWNDAISRAATLKSGACGLTDGSRAGQWRLPTRDELVRRSQNRQGFNNVKLSYYWSSSSYAGNTANAWLVLMGNGYEYYYDKGHNGFVWPVRAAQ